MNLVRTADLDRQYQNHLKHLKLKGPQPKTIDACARAIWRVGDYFDHQIDNLSAAQLTNFFSDLIASYSKRIWAKQSAVCHRQTPGPNSAASGK